jgi:phage terminase small subunit
LKTLPTFAYDFLLLPTISEEKRDMIMLSKSRTGEHPLSGFFYFPERMVMIVAAMTAKQQRFCDEYLIDMNATQAAIRAGYSKKTARVIGQENLLKPAIKEYIEKRMAEKEKALIADQDEVMKYLTKVMRRELCEHVVVTLVEEQSTYEPDGEGKMRKQTVKTEKPEIVEIPARLSDANKAAELLGKAYALFTDKLEADMDMELNITVDYGDAQ